MGTVDTLIAECHEATREGTPTLAVRDVLERVLADPATARLFAPDRAAFDVLHRAEDLTVLHIALPPGLGSLPHDHRMWAVVGVLDGQEDNTFFLRRQDGLEERGGRHLQARDVLVMGDDTVHAIKNPRSRYLSAIHVYGGDLLASGRSEWDGDGRNERSYDETRIPALVARANAAEDRLGRPLTAADLA